MLCRAAPRSGCAWGRLVADGVRVMARQCHVTSSLRHLARLPDSHIPPPRSSAFWQSQLSASEERSSPCHQAEPASRALSLLSCRRDAFWSVGLPSAQDQRNLPPQQKPRNQTGNDGPHASLDHPHLLHHTLNCTLSSLWQGVSYSRISG